MTPAGAPFLLENFTHLLQTPADVDRLNRYILQLAVQGKLVPQEPDDEPAIILLGKIQQENNRLKEIKRIRPFQRMDNKNSFDEFVIPNNWKWTDLQNIAYQITDGSHHTPGYSSEGIPFISVKDVSGGKIDFSNTRFITLEAHNELAKRCSPEKGDILLTKVGTTGIAVAVDTDQPFSLFVSIALIKIPTKFINCRFMELLLNSPYVKAQSEFYTMGIGNKNLVLKYIKQFRLPLPPLAEQQRIVARVEELFAQTARLKLTLEARRQTQSALVETAHRRLAGPAAAGERAEAWHFLRDHFAAFTPTPESIAQLRQTILQLAVQGKLVPQDPNDEPAIISLKKKGVSIPGMLNADEPLELPIKWSRVHLGDISEHQLGKTLNSKTNSGEFIRQYIRSVNVYWNRIDLNDLNEMRFSPEELEKYRINRGDLLILEGGYAGRSAIWPFEDKEMYHQNAIHRIRFFKGINPYFYFYFVWQAYNSGDLDRYFTGVAIKHFSGGRVKNLTVPLPPLAEQQRIVARVEELFALCDRLESRLAKARQVQATLAETIFTSSTQH